LEKISLKIKIIHFRKFASEKLVKLIIKNHSQVKKFSFSNYVYFRSESSVFDLIKENDIEVVIRNENPGRPNLLETIRL